MRRPVPAPPRSGAPAWALAAVAALAAIAAPVQAQTVNPRFSQVDQNGVDLVTGQFVYAVTEGTIGSGEGALTLTRYISGSNSADDWSGVLYPRTSGGTTLIHVEFGPIAETFTISGSTYTSTLANGSTLVALGGNQYRFTASDGTQIVFQDDVSTDPSPQCAVANAGACALPISITRPSGMTFTLDWTIEQTCGNYDEDQQCVTLIERVRLNQITSSANYRVTLSYDTGDWHKKTGATFTNLDSAPSTLPTSSWSNPSTGVTELVDTGGRTWRFTSNGNVLGIRRPGSSSDDITVYEGFDGYITTVVRDGVTTGYSRSISGSTVTATATTGDNATVVVSDLTTGRITSTTDSLSHTTGYQYDGNGRLTRVTRPEGNYVQYSYDARGNVTETRAVTKAGWGHADIVTEADYPSSCSNPVTCNLPTATRDALDRQTDHTYSATHGGLLTVTGPAVGGVRPQTRITYSQVTAMTGQPVYLPTNLSQCQTTSSCDGQADEVETNIAYNTSNLLPTSVSQGSGNGALVATTARTYDNIGNLLTVDGPLSGTADTIRIRYNASREVIGAIGPDPDGGGALKHRARRISYDGGGRVTDLETGTVDSQSDGDWAAMSVLEEVEQDYDVNHRPTVQRLESGGTVYAVTQTSYNALGQVDCVAQRMNPSEFSSLPGACSLDTEGDYGPDRINRNIYDALGRLARVRTALGTALERDVFIRGYSANGLVTYIQDAEDNLTDYVHDGHDRLTYIFHPVSTQGAQAASSSDYEQIGYHADGNVYYRVLRDGSDIIYGYDGLGRLATTNLPGSELDVSYSYDLLGRLTQAATSAQTLSFGYDALGRNTSQAGPHGTIGYGYDLAGRRTGMSYADSGLAVDYDYLVTGEVTRIRENGATSGAGVLGTYGYDDRGRRTSLTRGNGAATSYAYDNVSRMTQIVQNPASTNYDLTLDLGPNPAGQIASTTRSNDSYAWGGHYAVTRAYTANGRNQYSATGGITPTYDARGNLTSAGGTTYGYSSENMLISASGGVTLAYDPLLRLYQVAGGATTRLAYDGQRLIAEYNGSNVLQRRYVHGPGVDEPLVRYDGTDTSDRHWYHADERGSIIATSNGSGTVTAINSYDEYGIPGSGNSGRLQYTGQQWIGELGMYHYRARIYSPTLGRFLQTDPIEYEGGMNLYAYVLNDPVNFTDPMGLRWRRKCVGGDTLTCDWFWEEDNLDRITWGVAGNIFYMREIFKAEMCARGLAEAGQDRAAVQRAIQHRSAIEGAVAGTNADPATLAAIGVRETGFQNIAERGGGGGRGVFQITGQVPDSVAYSIPQSAEWTANNLTVSIRFIERVLSNVSPRDTLQVAIISHNLNIWRSERRDWTAQQFNQRSQGHNYGTNVMDIRQCFL